MSCRTAGSREVLVHLDAPPASVGHRVEVELERGGAVEVPGTRDERVHLAEPAERLALDADRRAAARVQERLRAASATRPSARAACRAAP